MKKIIIFLAIMFFSLSVVEAQDNSNDEFKTIFGSGGETNVSGFGGILMDFSTVDGDFGYSLGGEGAALFNKSVFIGLYGQALVNFPNYELTSYNAFLGKNITSKKSMMFYHGGIYTGFIFRPNNPIHFGISSKFGWGGLTLLDEFDQYHNNSNSNYDYSEIDLVFVVTPQIDAEMNVTNWFKLNLGFGYRFVSGIDATYLSLSDNGDIISKPYFDSNAMDSFVFSVGFLFGWYK